MSRRDVNPSYCTSNSERELTKGSGLVIFPAEKWKIKKTPNNLLRHTTYQMQVVWMFVYILQILLLIASKQNCLPVTSPSYPTKNPFEVTSVLENDLLTA